MVKNLEKSIQSSQISDPPRSRLRSRFMARRALRCFLLLCGTGVWGFAPTSSFLNRLVRCDTAPGCISRRGLPSVGSDGVCNPVHCGMRRRTTRTPTLLPLCMATAAKEGEAPEKSIWGPPPKEMVDEALRNAKIVIQEAGGSIDSISFGAVWKTRFPDFPRERFAHTTVTSFNKLLKVNHSSCQSFPHLSHHPG